jgi:hypothetical protein
MANSDYVMYQGSNRAFALNGTTPTATPVTGGTFDYTESSEVIGHASKDMPLTVNLANKRMNENTDTFFTNFLRNVDVAPSDFLMEDGKKITMGGTPADAVPLTFVHLSSKVGTKYRLTAFQGILVGDTGNVSVGSKALAEVPISAQSVAASATLIISAADIATLFADYGLTGATVTIPAGSYGTHVWIA